MLRLAFGDRRVWVLLPACVAAGAALHTLGFMAFVYGDRSAEVAVMAAMLPVLAFAYLIVPAGVGAWLAGAARERFERRS